MFVDVSILDMTNYNDRNINYNEVIIYKRDLYNIPRLMQYFAEHHIHIDEELSLNTLPKHTQIDIGLIFIENEGYYKYVEGQPYLDENKLRLLFVEDEVLNGYFDRAIKLGNAPLECLSILIFSTDQLYELILNFFNKIYRNSKSIDKTIEQSEILFDIDLNYGEFSKITDKVHFLLLMFERYIKTQKNSIPFSGGFGGELKSFLQRKADYFTQQLLEEEISSFIYEISRVYPNTYAFESLTYSTYGTIDVHVTVSIKFSIVGEDPVEVKVML